jgi:hypothetical protein
MSTLLYWYYFKGDAASVCLDIEDALEQARLHLRDGYAQPVRITTDRPECRELLDHDDIINALAAHSGSSGR